jgi:tRNA A37 methylthiotransferase MiaB
VITERAELLRSLGEKKKRQYLRRFLGRTLQPLVLKRDSDGLWNGLTANYLPVTFAAEGDFANNIVAVRVVNADGETLVAELLQ